MKELRDLFRVMAAERLEKELSASWFMQDRSERNFRLDAVVRLSIEWDKAQRANRTACALARGAIEEVILGDFKHAVELAHCMRFDEEDEEYRKRLAPNWETFVLMVETIAAEAERRKHSPSGSGN